MANPRRKHSKARTRTRRARYYGRLREPTMMECPNCGDMKVRHHACANCGHYRGRSVVETHETE